MSPLGLDTYLVAASVESPGKGVCLQGQFGSTSVHLRTEVESRRLSDRDWCLKSYQKTALVLLSVSGLEVLENR